MKEFIDHGIAAPVSRSRGITAITDAEGRNHILVWLMDEDNRASLLVIDAETGETKQLPRPEADVPFHVLHASNNRFYTMFGGVFLEFDIDKGAFTFEGNPKGGRMAMSMTERDGKIYVATYPDAQLVIFDPETRTLSAHGPHRKENWMQYPSKVAVDKEGWVYLAIGNDASNLVAYDPATKEPRQLTPEGVRQQGRADVHTAINGKVYGRHHTSLPPFELLAGEIREASEVVAAAPMRVGSQDSIFRNFGDGSRLEEIDLNTRTLVIQPPGGEAPQRLSFDYKSSGAHIQSVIDADDGRIYGSTGHPLRFFRYDPKKDEFLHRGLEKWNGHINALVDSGTMIYGGIYGPDRLIQYDVSREWGDTLGDNPKELAKPGKPIGRPHAILVHPDGEHVILAGTPGYGLPGGGLLFYSISSGEHTILDHTQLIENQSTMALTVLPNGDLVGGTTTRAGTGGESRTKEAELYLFDWDNRKIVFREAVVPGTREIRDLATGPDGLVYGLAQGEEFFVFDPSKREVVHRENLGSYGAIAGGQAPRVLHYSKEHDAFVVLFQNSMVAIEPGTFRHRRLAKIPTDAYAGMGRLDDRIYFSSGAHIWSYQLPATPWFEDAGEAGN